MNISRYVFGWKVLGREQNSGVNALRGLQTKANKFCRLKRFHSIFFSLIFPVLTVLGVKTMEVSGVLDPEEKERMIRVEYVDIPHEAAVELRNQILAKIDKKNLSYKRNLKKFSATSLRVVKDVFHDFNLDYILDLLKDNDHHSAVIFRGLPTDDVVGLCPATTNEVDGKEESGTLYKETLISESLLMAIGQLAGGNPVGYAFEKTYSHPIVHCSCPKEGAAIGDNSIDQCWHQDMSYLPDNLVPDLLGLVCVREGNDPTVTTDLLDTRDVLQFVSDQDKLVLRLPKFVFKTPAWASGRGELGKKPKAILSSEFNIALHVDWSNVQPVDDDAYRALEGLKKAIKKAVDNGYMISHHSKPGDLIIFSQKRTLHRRSPKSRPEPQNPSSDSTAMTYSRSNKNTKAAVIDAATGDAIDFSNNFVEHRILERVYFIKKTIKNISRDAVVKNPEEKKAWTFREL